MAGWSTSDLPDLSGRLAVVTGANSGLGWRCARALAEHGAEVLLGCRDERRGADAVERIRRELPAADVGLARLDLADLDTVASFAASVVAGGRLDLLVNNAGVMAIPYRATVDGFETQFGTNHLGHFALTGRLLPALLARPGARVVTVSSDVHWIGRIDFADLNAERGYRKWAAYGRSKLANLLFTRELARRASTASVDLIAAAAHPGYAATNLQAVGPRMAGQPMMERLSALGNRILAQDDAGGALPILYAATAPDVRGDDFYGPRWALRGPPASALRSPRARDDATAARLWAASEQLTGVTFDLTPA